jgi:hypothetical protein
MFVARGLIRAPSSLTVVFRENEDGEQSELSRD